jgi:alpha-D-ribose 1-methylphosphonate 5-triphosphate synthase subunit PhnH
MGRGFADAVQGAQQVFRTLLDATARPGRVLRLPSEALHGLQAPPALGAGTTALLLTLLDAETSVRLGAAPAGDAALAYLRFHTGAREALPGDAAAFQAWRCTDAVDGCWAALDTGSDDAPQRGGTLIVEVDALHAAPAPLARTDRHAGLRLHGPGIESAQDLRVDGLARSFWRERIALQPLFPRGIDLVLVCGTHIAALPRSTRITLED